MRIAAALVTLSLVTAGSVAPAFSAVRGSDAMATHAYLEATLAKRRADAAAQAAGVAAIRALAAKITASCPGVLGGAPRPVKGEPENKSRFEVSVELITASFGAAGPAEYPVLIHFRRVVRRLRWSNRRLTLLLHSLAKEDVAEATIAPPDLCADMSFWVASGYKAVSAGSREYLHRLDVVSSITQIAPEPGEREGGALLGLEELIAHRLKRYEDPADRALARRALPPQAKITDPRLRPLLEAAGSVFEALGEASPVVKQS